MLANFFSFGNRNYINNAVILSDALDKIISLFGDVKNLKLQFKRPFFSQGEFKISPHKIDGHYLGQFEIDETTLYFAYVPTGIPLENKILTVDDIYQRIDMINTCYYIAENCHQYGWELFENIYGPRTVDDKSIVVKYDIPDTKLLSDIIDSQVIPILDIGDFEEIGERRFKLPVFLNGKFFCNRYHSTKKFIV